MTETVVTRLHSVRAARLRLHLSILPTSMGLTALLGAVIIAARWNNTDHHVRFKILSGLWNFHC